jgi:flavorubredoxin
MAVQKLKDDVYFVGAVHWDRPIFDELVELPKGTSYNSYLIKGSKKTALLDTVDPDKTYELIRNLETLGVEKLDYVVAHHAEQDHSGSIPAILEKYPEAQVVTNDKCKGFLMDLMPIDESKFITVKDGDVLDLGDKHLRFIFTPWVHWPETMISYLEEKKMLFTCDFFGSHIASSRIFGPKDEMLIYEGAKHYYAEIMMPFRTHIKKHIAKIEELDFDMICPSHGTVHKNPKFIIDAYKNWVSDELDNEVLIPYISMHGSTKKMVEHLGDALIEKGIDVKLFNLTEAETGEVAMALVNDATVVFATPFVLAGAHPAIVSLAYLANALRPKAKFASIVASYGWGGKAVDHILGMLGNLKVDVIDPVLVKGDPKEADYKALDDLAQTIYEKHKSIGLID